MLETCFSVARGAAASRPPPRSPANTHTHHTTPNAAASPSERKPAMASAGGGASGSIDRSEIFFVVSEFLKASGCWCARRSRRPATPPALRPDTQRHRPPAARSNAHEALAKDMQAQGLVPSRTVRALDDKKAKKSFSTVGVQLDNLLRRPAGGAPVR